MYDDLARAQNPTPLEWFVVHAVIPSLALTLLMHMPSGDDCERGFQFSPQSSTGSDTMRAFSSVVSITAHAGLGAAVLFGRERWGSLAPGSHHRGPARLRCHLRVNAAAQDWGDDARVLADLLRRGQHTGIWSARRLDRLAHRGARRGADGTAPALSRSVASGGSAGKSRLGGGCGHHGPRAGAIDLSRLGD